MDKTREFAEWLVYHNWLFRGYDVDGLETEIRQWWHAWTQHPDYGRTFHGQRFNQEPHNPVVTFVCYHDPGAGGRTESYLVGPLADVTTRKQYEWCKRTIGQPYRLLPVSSEYPISPIRMLMVSYSYKGSGMAWRARLALKMLLPKRFHSLIPLARQWKRRPKYDYLKPRMSQRMHTAWVSARAQGTEFRYPRWYRQHTKAELFVMLTLRDVRDDLAQYIDPMDFWRCATGQIRPEKVKDHVLHQQALFELPPASERKRHETTTSAPTIITVSANQPHLFRTGDIA